MVLEPGDPLIDAPAEIDDCGGDHEPEAPRQRTSRCVRQILVARGAGPLDHVVVIDQSVAYVAPRHRLADPDPDLHRRRSEVECLPKRPLDVAQVGLREARIAEQREGRRVDSTLDGIANPCAWGRVP